jgi:hypothetical protein
MAENMLGCLLPLNMGTSLKKRKKKVVVNTKWIPTLVDKK